MCEDTDVLSLLVMLIHHMSELVECELYFSSSSGNQRYIRDNLTNNEISRLLFIHAFSGCDIVSGVYFQTKVFTLRLTCYKNCPQRMMI